VPEPGDASRFVCTTAHQQIRNLESAIPSLFFLIMKTGQKIMKNTLHTMPHASGGDSLLRQRRMLFAGAIFAVAAILALAPLPAAAASLPTADTLTPLAAQSIVYSINDNGVLGGAVSGSDNNTYEPGYWASSGSAFTSIASDINNSLYSDGGITSGIVYGINNSGIMTGTVTNSQTGMSNAFWRDTDGTFYRLNPIEDLSENLPTGAIDSSYSYGINNNGIIVGYHHPRNSSYGSRLGYWDTGVTDNDDNLVFVDLYSSLHQTLYDGLYVTLIGINDSMEAVGHVDTQGRQLGGYMSIDGSSIVDANGNSITQDDVFAGSTRGINNNGIIVGEINNSAVMWTSSDGFRTYETVNLDELAAHLLTGSESEEGFVGLTIAYDINDKNEIVGMGRYSDGQGGEANRAFLLTVTMPSAVPEPATWAMLAGLALLAWAIIRRRRG
jgi:hypothetical protein